MFFGTIFCIFFFFWFVSFINKCVLCTISLIGLKKNTHKIKKKDESYEKPSFRMFKWSFIFIFCFLILLFAKMFFSFFYFITKDDGSDDVKHTKRDLLCVGLPGAVFLVTKKKKTKYLAFFFFLTKE